MIKYPINPVNLHHLRSVWSYFDKIFKSPRKAEKDLIQSILGQLAEKYDCELPTKVRNFPLKYDPRPKSNNTRKRSRTDSNSSTPSKRLALDTSNQNQSPEEV